MRVVVQQLDKLEEDGAGLALGEYVDNHGRVEALAWLTVTLRRKV